MNDLIMPKEKSPSIPRCDESRGDIFVIPKGGLRARGAQGKGFARLSSVFARGLGAGDLLPGVDLRALRPTIFSALRNSARESLAIRSSCAFHTFLDSPRRAQAYSRSARAYFPRNSGLRGEIDLWSLHPLPLAQVKWLCARLGVAFSLKRFPGMCFGL